MELPDNVYVQGDRVITDGDGWSDDCSIPMYVQTVMDNYYFKDKWSSREVQLSHQIKSDYSDEEYWYPEENNKYVVEILDRTYEGNPYYTYLSEERWDSPLNDAIIFDNWEEANAKCKELTRSLYSDGLSINYWPSVIQFDKAHKKIRSSRKISSSQKGYENVVDGTPYDDYHIDTTGMGILNVEHIINEIESRGNQAVLTVQTSDGRVTHTQFNVDDWKKYKDSVNGVDEFAKNSGTYGKGAAITDVWVTEVKGGFYVRNSRKQELRTLNNLDSGTIRNKESIDKIFS